MDDSMARRCVNPLLDDTCLWLALVCFPAALTVLQLVSERSHVLRALEQKDPSALVHAGGFTDPHLALVLAHTWA